MRPTAPFVIPSTNVGNSDDFNIPPVGEEHNSNIISRISYRLLQMDESNEINGLSHADGETSEQDEMLDRGTRLTNRTGNNADEEAQDPLRNEDEPPEGESDTVQFSRSCNRIRF